MGEDICDGFGFSRGERDTKQASFHIQLVMRLVVLDLQEETESADLQPTCCPRRSTFLVSRKCLLEVGSGTQQ